MIDFTRAFDTAWERMLVILFRPFDFEKWCVIAFNAFLILLAQGVSFNQPFHFETRTKTTYNTVHQGLHAFNQWLLSLQGYSTSPWLALYIGGGIALLLIWLVLNWVSCRGEFLFLDNLVRNRGAIAWPWNHYAVQGNTWFLFHLVNVMLSCVLSVVSVGVLLVVSWTWIRAERVPTEAEIMSLASLGFILALIWVVYAAVLFVIRSFTVAILFRQEMGFWAAFSSVLHLMATQPVSISAYVLISFLLTLAKGILTLILSLLTCCLICWLTIIPVIGSMLVLALICAVLLPVFVWIRCFQLDCLAQCDPRFDAFTVDVPKTMPMPPRG